MPSSKRRKLAATKKPLHEITKAEPALAMPSAKRRKLAATKVPLHKPTKAAPAFATEDEKTCGHAVNTGTFKNRNLWDREEFESVKVQREGAGVVSDSAALAAACAKEYQRWVAAKKSRNLLERLVKEQTSGKSAAPIMAWERWHASCKLFEQVFSTDPIAEWFLPRHFNAKKKSAKKDGDGDWGCASLQEDLMRLPGVSAETAKGIADRLLKESSGEAKVVTQVGRKGKDKKARENGLALPTIQQCKYSFDVQYKGKLLKLNIPHHEKLRKLYMGSEEGFVASLYLVLQRYHSLLGHGMQCACSEHVFDALKATLGVTFECFASPLNCRFPRYCSAFPDTDKPFGSMGSFLDCFGSLTKFREVFPKGGSFEANPPFIPRIMEQMVARIAEIVEGADADTPVSFVLILPGWKEQSYWRKLTAPGNKMVKSWFLVAADEHGFVSGAQHQRKDRLLDSPFDTAVFALQNQRGSEKYTVATGGKGSFEACVREAFRRSLPTDAMRERRMKEGRGFGDRDGAGGVYKGKKRNRKAAGMG